MRTLQAIYRSIIMLGTLVVLGMAYQVYGPPPEELGGLIDRAHGWASQAIDRWRQASPRLEPMESLALAPVEAPQPVDFMPAATLPAAPPPLADVGAEGASELPTMMAQLNQLGMGAHKLHRWGSTGELYRFECSVSCPGQAVLEQHFEAIAGDPAEAVASVMAQVRQHR